MPQNAFSVANCVEAPFANVRARCLFAREKKRPNPAFMKVVEVWDVRVTMYSNDVLGRNPINEHITVKTRGTSIVAENIQVLIREGITAAWEQMQISQVFSNAILHVPPNEFGAIIPTK